MDSSLKPSVVVECTLLTFEMNARDIIPFVQRSLVVLWKLEHPSIVEFKLYLFLLPNYHLEDEVIVLLSYLISLFNDEVYQQIILIPYDATHTLLSYPLTMVFQV